MTQEMNDMMRRQLRSRLVMQFDEHGRGRVSRVDPHAPEGDAEHETPRLVEGTADGGKGQAQEPGPRVKTMNDLLREEAFITQARRIREGLW